MTALLEREEWGAFSDVMALLGTGLCIVIGLVLAVAGKDQVIAFHGWLLLIASCMAGIYLLERFLGKEKPPKDTRLCRQNHKEK
jgi:hypothetical protein